MMSFSVSIFKNHFSGYSVCPFSVGLYSSLAAASFFFFFPFDLFFSFFFSETLVSQILDLLDLFFMSLALKFFFQLFAIFFCFSEKCSLLSKLSADFKFKYSSI